MMDILVLNATDADAARISIIVLAQRFVLYGIRLSYDAHFQKAWLAVYGRNDPMERGFLCRIATSHPYRRKR